MRKLLSFVAAALLATSAFAQTYIPAGPIAGNGSPPAAGAAGQVDVNGHFLLGKQSTPTVASGACGTGTNGSITSGSDQSFELAIGAVATTSCVVSFGSTWTTRPRSCVMTAGNAAGIAAGTLAFIPAAGVTATTVTITGTALASTLWNVQCQ